MQGGSREFESPRLHHPPRAAARAGFALGERHEALSGGEAGYGPSQLKSDETANGFAVFPFRGECGGAGKRFMRASLN